MNSEIIDIENRLIGAWDLLSFRIERDDGSISYPFGEDVHGSIIYTPSGRVSAQVMQKDRPLFSDDDQLNGTHDEIMASFKCVISYYGSYELHTNEGYVAHKVEGSLFPNWQGGIQKRFYEFTEDRLKLSSPPISWGGGRQNVGVLIWQRIG